MPHLLTEPLKDPLILLLLLPLIPALLALVVPGTWRPALVWLGGLAVIGFSIMVAAKFLGAPQQTFALDGHGTHAFGRLVLGGELLLTIFLLWKCLEIKRSETYVPVLLLVQAALMLRMETGTEALVPAAQFYVDSFSVIMVLIIGVIGGLIAIYAASYMDDYHHHHHDVPDRRGRFFFVIFMFLSAMFGIVVTNHLGWLIFFWEVTTLCSFWLIGYSRTDEAVRNSFRALGMNVAGGLAFTLAIFWLVKRGPHTLGLLELSTVKGAAVLVPAALLSFAGLTKSAQMPFSSWLLGAMVAPTPVSALLHSSTMVNAGVFLLVKLAPALSGTVTGLLVALVGGVTFLMTSLLAVTQSNAKRVLAYSTIANLGLVVMCAGVGTPVTVWAGILLIIFHAIAKGLLFLCMGTTEHQVGSRDIEDQEGFIVTRPWLAMLIGVGILGMFLAPFGMLISKYTCLKAIADTSVLLAVILAFGSAPTLFFWTKWLGKVVSVPRRAATPGGPLPISENFALTALAVATFCASVFFPALSWSLIDPYLTGVFGPEGGVHLGTGMVAVMCGMLVVLFLLPVAMLLLPSRQPASTGYLGGANVSGSATYRGAAGTEREVGLRNYYLRGLLDEGDLFRASWLVSGLILVLMFSPLVLKCL